MSKDFLNVLRENNAFAEMITDVKKNKYIQIVILRELQSYGIFTTEGRILNVAETTAGVKDNSKVTRVLMIKRKQVASERRTGKALRRKLIEKGLTICGREDCSLIQHLCGKCPDCMLYGYAAQGGDNADTNQSRKTRVITDTAFSIREYGEKTVEEITLNAIDEETHSTGTALSSKEHIKPGVIFPCVETLVDVTEDEFLYVLANILLTTRYGAEANRGGLIKNHIVGIYISNQEVFTNLELTKYLYDELKDKLDDIDVNLVKEAFNRVEDEIIKNAFSSVKKVDNINTFIEEFRNYIKDDTNLMEIYQNIEKQIEEYSIRKVEEKGEKSKSRKK